MDSRDCFLNEDCFLNDAWNQIVKVQREHD